MPVNNDLSCADCQSTGDALSSVVPTSSRRTLLKLGSAGVVVAALPAGCGGSAADDSPPNVMDLPVGALRVLGSQRVVVGRDAGGLYAMTAICTHQGCTVGVVGSALQCPCHGSRFSALGAVNGGPATAPLKHLQVTVAVDGTITVTDQVVGNGVRTPVA